MSPEEIAAGLSANLRLALNDIQDYSQTGYVWNWRPKSREKLQAMGLVTPLARERRQGQNIDVCRLTPLGRAVAEALTEVKS